MRAEGGRHIAMSLRECFAHNTHTGQAFLAYIHMEIDSFNIFYGSFRYIVKAMLRIHSEFRGRERVRFLNNSRF
ncbi:hypothetical protein SUGI_0515180 [Cryptomeria japonica]|nr:hypothetical protein SUGI_0515180 [Cryptomeria japonica]